MLRDSPLLRLALSREKEARREGARSSTRKREGCQSPSPEVVWYKQCKSRRCWEVKLSPREVSKDTLTTPFGVVNPHK